MIARLQAWLAVAGAAVAAIIAAWLKGRSQGRADAKARQDADYRKTRERIDHAGNDAHSIDDGELDRRLHDHAGKQ